MATSAPPRRAGARDRLLAAAERLFEADGIRAVGVDRLCAEAQVSKRSLYQHFAGKDDVVTTMLSARTVDLGADDSLPPREQVLAVFDQVERAAAAPDYRGCPFVAAAVEIKDPTHPAAEVARTKKRSLTSWFARLLTEGGARDVDLLATQLTLLFDGASAYAVVQGGSTPATRAAVETLLAAHGM